MTILQALIILISLFLVPVLMGQIMAKDTDSLKLKWVEGFLLEWAIVFVVATPLIVKEGSFATVAWLVMPICLSLSIVGILLFVKRPKNIFSRVHKFNGSELIYLGIFVGIVLFQIYKAIFYAYEDGDDAYYIAMAQNAVSSEIMYRQDAYIGIPTVINYRYALAPFPIWISILSFFSKVNVAIIAHTVLPVVLLLVTYAIYGEIAKELFKGNREKRYMLLILIAVFVMFENVSTSTAGTFLITRARQGKEALANVILPFMFLVTYRIIADDFAIRIKDMILVLVTAFAASLTSMLANVLVPLMLLFLFIYAIVKKRSLKTLISIAVMAFPNIVVALGYIVL